MYWITTPTLLCWTIGNIMTCFSVNSSLIYGNKLYAWFINNILICLINYKLRRSLGQNIKIPFRIKVHNLLAQNYSLRNFFIFVAHSQNQETWINCYQYDDRQKTIEGCSPLWPRNSSLSRLNSSSSKVFCFVSASNSFRHWLHS